MRLSPGTFNIVVALLAAAAVFGPVALLLWFSWRNVLAGAMLFGAFAVVMFSLMAVGASGWSPNGSVGLFILLALAVAAGLALGAWFLATGTIGFRVATVALSIVAAGWVTLGWGVLASSLGYADVPVADYLAVRFSPGKPPVADRAWYRDGARQAGTARLRDSLDRALGVADTAAADPQPDMLLVRNANGELHRVAPRPNLDIAFFGSGVIRNNRMFVRFISDRRLDPYLAGRDMTLMTWSSKEDDVLKPRRSVPVVFTTARRLDGSFGAFYDPSSAAFTIGPYRWMKDVLRIPKPERDALYRKYFGTVPE